MGARGSQVACAPCDGRAGSQASVWVGVLAPAASSRLCAQTLSLAAQVGPKIFADRSLSASGQLACATCHDPAHACAAPNGLAVQLGSPGMSLPGTRAVAALRGVHDTVR
jgi:cytochrome c peroxidase